MFETKKDLTDDMLYDAMSVVNDKLTPEEIQLYWHNTDLIESDPVLTDDEKQELIKCFMIGV